MTLLEGWNRRGPWSEFCWKKELRRDAITNLEELQSSSCHPLCRRTEEQASMYDTLLYHSTKALDRTLKNPTAAPSLDSPVIRITQS